MTNDELNKYILHYLEHDKTHSAIMLTAPWGTGKSYYIQNELKPFLEKEENGKHKCIVVSLYGLKTLADISKELYMESKTPAIFKRKKYKKFSAFSKPNVSGIVGVGKTVLKALTQIDLDFSVDNPNWQKLYSAVDFSGKLIVFEDLERSEIDVLEIMGYVNSLVDQDGVKVLLVANETEILKYSDGEPDKDGKTHKIPDEDTKEYLRTKEKTVSDTIQFVGNLERALESILRSFENSTINRLLTQKDSKEKAVILSEIGNVIDTVKDNNLRSIIFGCQKTIDLYQIIDKMKVKFDDGFLSYLLCSNIAFSLRLKNDDSIKIKWEGENGLYSQKLGTYHFPLLRTAYNYIVSQFISKEELILANNLYCMQKEFEKSQAEIKKHLDVIYSYYDHYEKDVADALYHVTENLEKAVDIPVNEFGKLANYLVAVHSAIGHDDEILRCRSAMVERLKTCKNDEQTERRISFHDGLELKEQDKIRELDEWKKEMIDALKSGQEKDLAFDYQPESVAKFYETVCSHRSDIVNKRCFASQFDVVKIVDFLKKATPEQIGDLRSTFHCVYGFSNIGDFFTDDKETLVEMKHAVDKLIEGKEIEDKIVLLQLKWFSENLQSFIDRL